jgi:hypothetical protein
MNLVFVAFPVSTQNSGERANTTWLWVRIMCPSRGDNSFRRLLFRMIHSNIQLSFVEDIPITCNTKALKSYEIIIVERMCVWGGGLLFNANSSIVQLYHTLRWDDDDCFVLDQHALLDFYCAWSPKQQSAERVVNIGFVYNIPLYIICYWNIYGMQVTRFRYSPSILTASRFYG